MSAVPAGEVRRAAADLAATLAAGPTAAYAETKRLLWDGPSRPLAEVLAAESAAQHRLSLTADHAEVTALAAATVIFDMITLLARARRG